MGSSHGGMMVFMSHITKSPDVQYARFPMPAAPGQRGSRPPVRRMQLLAHAASTRDGVDFEQCAGGSRRAAARGTARGTYEVMNLMRYVAHMN
jgi:hypothetical protein